MRTRRTRSSCASIIRLVLEWQAVRVVNVLRGEDLLRCIVVLLNAVIAIQVLHTILHSQLADAERRRPNAGGHGAVLQALKLRGAGAVLDELELALNASLTRGGGQACTDDTGDGEATADV